MAEPGLKYGVLKLTITSHEEIVYVPFSPLPYQKGGEVFRCQIRSFRNKSIGSRVVGSKLLANIIYTQFKPREIVAQLFLCL